MTTPRRRLALLTAFVALTAALACGDPYSHSNPYDPAVPVAITLRGPDTLFSYRELGVYTARSEPAFPDSAFEFGSSDSVAFAPAGRATFTSAAPPLFPATRTAEVVAGLGAIDTQPPGAGGAVGPGPHVTAFRHIGSRLVVLTQRVTQIRLRCPDTHACDTLAVGAAWSVWVDGLDALNHQIVALTSSVANPANGIAVATFVSRDSSIALPSPVGIRASTVTARRPGTTWIVAIRGALLDSLRLSVR